ncbi:transcription factor bHLH162-like [Arachis duranensis]|uniref:Transcription factor bHLH162-like n=1 Tax=Arachis duranensis TaxID=130453 RepID=A0A6P4BA11_ARADU|nr:transcription factor bHLH162-like [Arachis duranensis]
MDHHQQQQHQQGSEPSTTTKVERKIIERNRRNKMKDLYSKLNSLLPSYSPTEVLPLPDQIDEAVKYIKSLEKKVKMAKEKKERLLKGRNNKKRSRGFDEKNITKSPMIDVHEMGNSLLQVVLTCGFENKFLFNEIIRILHEEKVEIVSVNSSSQPGDSMIHVLHAEIPSAFQQFGAARVSERLKRFVNGSISDVDIDPGFWDDFEIDTDIWELPDLSSVVSKGFPNPL